jgi:hypothetical protein
MHAGRVDRNLALSQKMCGFYPPTLYCTACLPFRFFGRVDRNIAFREKDIYTSTAPLAPLHCIALPACLLDGWLRQVLIFRFFGRVDPNLAFREKDIYTSTAPLAHLYCTACMPLDTLVV